MPRHRRRGTPHLPQGRSRIRLCAGAYPLVASAQGTRRRRCARRLKPFEQPSAFVRIDTDGTVTVTINRLDFGQGVQTGLPMILAEELDADWSKVRSVHGDANPAYADPAFGMHLTGGSNSLKNSYTQYRELGARTRAMLVSAAAAQWGVDASTCAPTQGFVVAPAAKAGLRRAGRGRHAAARARESHPKDPKQFRIIGKPTGRLDAQAKSSGQQDYGIDVRLPGMLTAVVARPPVFGAKLKSLDDSAAKAIKGVKAVLRVPTDRGGEGVAIIAEGYWPAKQGRDALKVEWDTASVEKPDTAQLLTQYRAPGPKPAPSPSPPMWPRWPTRRKNQRRVHLPLPGPRAHGAAELHREIDGDKAELWMGTQMPGLDAMAAAKVLGLQPQNVKVHTQMAGGGFGRRCHPHQRLRGGSLRRGQGRAHRRHHRPVRTLWSREDDIKGGYYRPMHVHRAEIGLTPRATSWRGPRHRRPVHPQGLAVRGLHGQKRRGFHGRGGHERALQHPHAPLGTPPAGQRARAVVAQRGQHPHRLRHGNPAGRSGAPTKQDPVAYRLRLMGDKHPRHKAACNWRWTNPATAKRNSPQAAPGAWRCTSRSARWWRTWWKPPSAKTARRLHSVTAGVHCNLAVNPKSVEAQVQGGALDGPVHVPARRRHHPEGRRGGAKQLRRLRRAPHHRHAPGGRAHRAQRRAAYGMGPIAFSVLLVIPLRSAR